MSCGETHLRSSTRGALKLVDDNYLASDGVCYHVLRRLPGLAEKMGLSVFR